MTDKWAIYDELLAGIPGDLAIEGLPRRAQLVRRRVGGDGSCPELSGQHRRGDVRPPYKGGTVAEVAALVKTGGLPDSSWPWRR